MGEGLSCKSKSSLPGYNIYLWWRQSAGWVRRYSRPKSTLFNCSRLSSFSVTLIALLIHWAASNSPRYASQNGIVPCKRHCASELLSELNHCVVISDLGAQELKPLFVIGCIIAAFTFLATLIIIHRRRTMLDWTLTPLDPPPPTVEIVVEDEQQKEAVVEIPKPSTRGGTVSSWVALVFTSMALISLILLAGFDCLLYPWLHSVFLMTFGIPLFIGAIGGVSLVGIQMAAYPECRWLRKALWMKAVSGLLVLVMTIAFAARMATAERPYDEQFDQAGK
jgi:hypothetical protein